MRKFLLKLTGGALTLVILLAAAVLLTKYYAKDRLDWSLSPDTHLLIVGDSHPATALNDTIIPHALNLSQTGEAYFFTYYKLRELLRHNPQVETVVLGYGYHNLQDGQDRRIFQDKYVQHRLHKYLTFMDGRGFWAMFRRNPEGVFLNLIRTIQTQWRIAAERPSWREFNYGNFVYLDRDKLEEARRRLGSEKDESHLGNRLEKTYLRNIHDLCVRQGRHLILMNTPIYPDLQAYLAEYRPEYHRFQRRYLPEARLLDYGSFTLPDSAYGDLGHLNFRGSTAFSRFLLQNHWSSMLCQRCPNQHFQ